MRKASLKQHRTHGGRWQLLPVLVVNGRPDPRTVLIGENPIFGKDPGGGKFYLDYRNEQGKRVRQLVFPTKPHPKRPNYDGEQPDAHHLKPCKNIAFKAALNCGHGISKDRNSAD